MQFSDNSIGKEGATALADALRVNSSLQRLRLESIFFILHLLFVITFSSKIVVLEMKGQLQWRMPFM